MKIYFGFTVAGDRSSIDIARNIVQLLEEMGHEGLLRREIRGNRGDDLIWQGAEQHEIRRHGDFHDKILAIASS